jgi:hypothetical protein
MGVALPVATLAATVISGAVSAYGAYSQGQAASASASYQSQVAANNAVLAQVNADSARRDASFTRDQANAEQRNQIRKTRAMIGAQITGAASHGLLVSEGTPAEMRQDTAELGAEGAANIREAGNRRAAAFDMRAFDYEQSGRTQTAQSGLYAGQASSSALGGILGAGGTLLTAAGTTYGRYSDMRRDGVFQSNPPVVQS